MKPRSWLSIHTLPSGGVLQEESKQAGEGKLQLCQQQVAQVNAQIEATARSPPPPEMGAASESSLLCLAPASRNVTAAVSIMHRLILGSGIISDRSPVHGVNHKGIALQRRRNCTARQWQPPARGRMPGIPSRSLMGRPPPTHTRQCLKVGEHLPVRMQ